LDRLADKIFICSLIIFMAWGHSPGDSAPGWLKTLSRGIVGVIILFECFLMVSGTWGTFQGKNITSNQFARIKMVLQSIAVTFWFICLAVVRQGIGMFWPLIIVVADILLIFSAFYAVKSLKIYAEEFFGGN
jgi:phosphatidylglycerophosphate synthase